MPWVVEHELPAWSIESQPFLQVSHPHFTWSLIFIIGDLGPHCLDCTMRAVFISLCAASNSPRRGFDMLSSSSYVHSATLHDPLSFLLYSQTHIQPPRRYAGKIDSIQELAAPRRTVPSHVSFWFGVLVFQVRRAGSNMYGPHFDLSGFDS